MTDTIKGNAVWYRKMLRDKDNSMAKLKKENEKEISDLN